MGWTRNLRWSHLPWFEKATVTVLTAGVCLTTGGLPGPSRVFSQAVQEASVLNAPRPRRLLDADWPLVQDVSADGRIGVGRQRAGWSTLRVVTRDLATGESRVLFSGGGRSTISDDGRVVAFQTANQLAFVGTEPGAAPDVVPPVPGTTVYPVDWAPNGDAVLVQVGRAVADGGQRGPELAWFIRADRSFRPIRAFAPGQEPTLPRIAPSGRHIAFTAPAPQGAEGRFVFVMDIDGRAIEPIVAVSGASPNPVWTPDSRRLLFTQERDGRVDLWSIAIENGRTAGEPRLVYPALNGFLLGISKGGVLYYRRSNSPNDSEYAGNFSHIVPRDSQAGHGPVTVVGCCPSLAPDGKSIALVNFGGQLVVRRIDSSAERTQRLPGAVVTSPKWLPDSSGLIAVVQAGPRRDAAAFYQVDVSSGDFRRLFEVGTRSGEGDVAPDGKTLYAVARPGQGQPAGIVAVDLASGRERLVVTLSSDRQMFGFPAIAVSPDGRTLAATMFTDPGQTRILLAIVGVDGSNYREVTSYDSSWVAARWLPDGKAVLFPAFDDARNWRIMRASIEDGSTKWDGLSYDSLAPLVPDIRLNPGNFSGLDVSQDGARVVVSTLTLAKSEIWTLDGLSWDR